MSSPRTVVLPLIVPLGAAVLLASLYLLDTVSFPTAVIATAVATLCLIANWWTTRSLQRRLDHLRILAEPWLFRGMPADALAAVENAFASIARQFDSHAQQARTEKGQLQAVLSGMAEGVIVLDRSSVIQLANARAADLFDADDPTALRGKSILQLSRDPDLHGLVQRVTKAPTDKPLFAEITLGRRPHQEVLNVTASAVPTEGEHSSLSILVFHDVTELKRLEATRSDFVANVSHEIRTPLTAIRGYAETLRAGAMADPEQARHFLGVIERHSERLSRLTDDLLALSDLELGRAALRRERMNVAPAVDAALDVVRERAQRGRVTLAKQIGTDLPLLTADSDRIVQVLVNLADNAVKYTDAGGTVTVSADRASSPADLDATLSWLELRVEDTGVGIPSADLPRLTERFYRVDKARSRELGGTGLGLAIVKHIVQAHGGALRIDSEVGKGTTVRVYLPLVSDAV